MEKLINRKNELDIQLMNVLNNPTMEEYNKLLSVGSNFYTEVEAYIFRNSDSQENLSMVQAEDILNTIKNTFDFVINYNEMMRVLSNKLQVQFSFAPNFLSTAQSIYKKYRPKEAKEYLLNFQKNDIPTTGFKSKNKIPLQTAKRDFLAVIIGLTFCITSFIIGFTTGIRSSIQYWLIRIAVSFGVSLIFSGFGKDLIKTKLKFNRLLVTACGAIGIFLVLYLVNPPDPPEYKPVSEQNMPAKRYK